MIFSLRFLDREIVDGRVAQSHQATVIKLPILIAVGTKPIPGVIVPFVRETHGNTVPGVSPEFFDKAIIQFLRPLAL
jgi:hypothetical protein